MRVVGQKNAKGSLRWIRRAVNWNSALLNTKVREQWPPRLDEAIEWVSPLEDDGHAEYRDQDFLDRLGIAPSRVPISEFWPTRGPQWDALARTESRQILLVEAKANIPEIVSSGSGASNKESKALIEKSLNETKAHLKVAPEIPWSGKLYQYTNRLAHLYFLRELNKIDAYLAFIYFTGAKDVEGPNTIGEWEAALTVVKHVLGLGARHRLSKYVAEIFIDVEKDLK